MSDPIFEITSPDPKRFRARLHPSAQPIASPWRWPLPRLGCRSPIVLVDSVEAERHSVDLGYALAPFDSDLFIPVFAAQAGEVSVATQGADGFAVSIVHGDWTTHYAHLSEMFVTRCLPRTRRRQFVPAGTVIGYAAKSPIHIRFELWQWTDESGFVAVDPIPHLNDWSVASVGNERRELAATGPDEAA